MYNDKLPICKDKRTCGMSATTDGIKKCACLHTTYPDGKCPFCKPDKAYTNDKWYPHFSYSGKGNSAAG